MSEQDSDRWDERYRRRGVPSMDDIGPEPVFEPHLDVFPRTGRALDIASGQGAGAVWLALRGLDVLGLDVSAVAIAQARGLAGAAGVAARCRFDVAELDAGLPGGPPVDVVYCTRFRDARLDRAIIDRLLPGGLLAITVLSRVGGSSGPFRAAPGELRTAFADLDPVAEGEGQGLAWLLARRRIGLPD